MSGELSPRPHYLGLVQPTDCDVMGHFTVRRYAAAFDDASYHFLADVTGEPPLSADARLGWVDVRQCYDYLAELRAGDLYWIAGAVDKVGEKSMTATYRLVRQRDDALCARMTTTLVRFDLETRRAVAIERAMRRRLVERLQPSA